MQITLIQVEIEEAIRRFVASQINVREGMRIDIELKATRGAEGYQAYIDIVEQNAERKIGNGEDEASVNEAPPATPVKAAPAATPAPVATTTKASPVRTTTRKTNPPVPAEPPVQAQPEESVEDQGVAEESILDQPDPVAEDIGDDTVGVAEEAPAAPVRSLFGGLTRPKND